MELLTNQNLTPNLFRQNTWSCLAKRGVYMKGTIKSTVDSVCVKCSKEKFKQIYNDIVGYSIPVCVACGGLPTKLKVSRNVPIDIGKSKSIDIYKNLKKEPLTKISDALAVLGRLDNELTSGAYRPEAYSSKTRDDLKFSVFADDFVKNYLRRTKLPQEHDDYLTPAGFTRGESVIRLHLKPHFGDTNIREIKQFEILAFHRKWIDKFRTRNLATAQLKTMLIYARQELGALDIVPVFPKLAKANERRAEEIPSIEIQSQIILNISNQLYRDAWTLIACFAKRSCEGRAWKVKDWNTEKGILITQRHFSRWPDGGEVLVDGRKSIKKTEKKGTHYDYPDSFLAEILNRNCEGKKADDFIFSGDKKDFVSITSLNDAWKVSAKKLGHDIAPYIGTKHATLSAILKDTGNMASTANFSGHTNEQTLQRYAQLKTEDNRKLVNSERFRVSEKKVMTRLLKICE
jgi:hypothetical protein